MLGQTIDINVRHSVTTMADSDLEAIAKRGAIDGEFTDVTPSIPGLPVMIDG